jgi:hypothetical protein
MTTQAHTSGPWDIVQDAPLNPRARFNIGSRGPGGTTTYVCTIKTEKHLALDGNEEANAHLIAAAPEMLEALRAMVARGPFMDQRATAEGLANCEALAKARHAIRQAEGEQ